MKIAAGNPGKRKINSREPKAAGTPIPPEHLKGCARRAWFALCPMLSSMGVLSTSDAMALERLCELYAEIVELQADIQKNGRAQEVKTESGDVMERARPQVAMLADADRRFKSYLVEFGLSPAARSKVNVSEVEKQSPAAGYFG